MTGQRSPTRSASAWACPDETRWVDTVNALRSSSAAPADPEPQEAPAPDRQTALDALRGLRRQSPTTWIDPEVGWVVGFLGELAAVLAALGGTDDAIAAVAAAADQPDDADALYLAGWQLADIGLGDLAVAPLGRSLSLRPGHTPALDELALALEEAGRPDEAARLYRANPAALDSAESSRALYSHYAAMAGDLGVTQHLVPLIDPAGPHGFFRERAIARVARMNAVAGVARLDSSDLRGWEVVLNGMLLLHPSEIGTDEMNGRFGAIWDNPDRFEQILSLLQAVLDRVDRQPTQIVAAADRDSQILGWALAARFGLDAPHPVDGEPPSSGTTLVSLFNWSSLDEQIFSRYGSDQRAVLFGYSLDWTQRSSLAPDVVGLEAQATFPVWGEHMRVVDDPAGGAPRDVIREPIDDRDAGVVGRELGSRTPVASAERDGGEVLSVAAAMTRQPDSCGLLGGARDRYYTDGPVRSNRFSL